LCKKLSHAYCTFAGGFDCVPSWENPKSYNNNIINPLSHGQKKTRFWTRRGVVEPGQIIKAMKADFRREAKLNSLGRDVVDLKRLANQILKKGTL